LTYIVGTAINTLIRGVSELKNLSQTYREEEASIKKVRKGTWAVGACIFCF
jgi:hypothetical protein